MEVLRKDTKMLLGKLVLQKQECEGNYNFDSKPVYTKGFSDKFGDISSELVSAALIMLNNSCKNPDYIQVFCYENKKFWVVANFEKGDKIDNYEDIEEPYVTFMLPEEY